MRRTRKKTNLAKLGFTFIVLLSSLAMMGVSYSAWYENLYIQGTVTTGNWTQECIGNETMWARMNNDSEDFTYEFPGSNWATYIIHKPTEDPATFYFYAGQWYFVGELTIWKDSNYLYVKYALNNSYTMSELHLHIATSLNDIPQKNGNPIPGKFKYKMDFDPYVDEYLYAIKWKPAWNDKDLFIAAHGVVWGPNIGECAE